MILFSIPDPNASETYRRSCLNWQMQESGTGRRFYKLYTKLLALRRDQIIPRLTGMQGDMAQYQIIGPKALQVSWILGDGSRLHVIINFAAEPVCIKPPSKAPLYTDHNATPYLWDEEIAPPQSISWFLDIKDLYKKSFISPGAPSKFLPTILLAHISFNNCSCPSFIGVFNYTILRS